MEKIQEYNRRRIELIRKKCRDGLDEAESHELFALKTLMLDYVTSRNPRDDHAIRELERETADLPTTAVCTRCGGQVGHPGPCPRCVPNHGLSIQRAIDIARDAHRLHFRRKPTRVPYLTHVFGVVNQLAVWGFNADDHAFVFEVALLHDSVEDHGIEPERLKDLVSFPVWNAVMELSVFAEKDKDYAATKRDYMESFADKSVLSLVVKVADRLCNVRDFMVTRSDYAPKYYAKASHLFRVVQERREEVITVYGETIYHRMMRSVLLLDRELNADKTGIDEFLASLPRDRRQIAAARFEELLRECRK